MPDFFDRPFQEWSQHNGYSGNRIARWSENRAEGGIAAALADEATRLMLFAADKPLLKLPADGGADPRFTAAEAAQLGLGRESLVLLGIAEGAALLAGTLRGEAPTGDRVAAIDLRSLATQGLLPAEQLSALAHARSMLHWHGNSRFCGRCGAPTVVQDAGASRLCTACGLQIFPRVDPVVIMLAIDGERCLMGRQPRFEPGRYSALAGFLEPGETIEEAVRRETGEEAGIAVGRVRYHSSQVWPFPSSLMIGCHAEALSTEIVRDAAELEDCRWFDRDEVRRILAGTHPDGLSVPPPFAIARMLIEAFVVDA